MIRPPLVRNDGPELGHARRQRAYVTQCPDITKPRPTRARHPSFPPIASSSTRFTHFRDLIRGIVETAWAPSRRSPSSSAQHAQVDARQRR